MNFSRYLLLLIILPAFCFSQKTYKTLRIGDKDIRLLPKQMVEAKRLFYDTIIEGTPHIRSKPNADTWSFFTSPDSIVPYKLLRIEEVYLGKKGVIRLEKRISKPFTDYDFADDSLTCIKIPYGKVDTINCINPITLEETLVFEFDTAPCFKYNLGTISKTDFLASAKNNFGNQLQLNGMVLYMVTDTVIFRSYNLRKPFYEQIEKSIKGCKAGTIINLDISYRLNKRHNAYVWDIAFFTLTD